MSPNRAARGEIVFVLLLAATYLAVCLSGLGTTPPVYEDEPWQAASAWKLAHEGTFGSDLFAGLDGLERHCFTYPPVHPILLAATFRLAGVGLVQARFETVTMGLLALLATWALGRRLGGPRVGGIAALLLVTVRTSYVGRYQPTGILFLDTVRIARYDAVVPLFALLAFLAASRAVEQERRALWALSGLLAALASLTHLYALFLLAPLLAFALWERAGGRALGCFVAGFLPPWLAYAGWAATDVASWIAQTRGYAPRFRLFDPAWYLDNLTREGQRYGQGFGELGLSWLSRPGFWAVLVAMPFALALLLTTALRREPGEPAPGAQVAARHAARLLVLPVLLLPPLYAFLLWLKLPNYRLMVQPFCALALAWGLVRLWRSGASSPRRIALLRAALVTVGLLVAGDAAGQIVARERAARSVTPWDEFAARIDRAIPPEGRLLVLHHFWFGFESRDVRSWLVPLLQSLDASGDYVPERLVNQLDDLAPTTVLIDRRMRDLFEHRPEVGAAVRGWLTSRSFVELPPLEDLTYGRVELFVAPTASAR